MFYSRSNGHGHVRVSYSTISVPRCPAAAASDILFCCGKGEVARSCKLPEINRVPRGCPGFFPTIYLRKLTHYLQYGTGFKVCQASCRTGDFPHSPFPLSAAQRFGAREIFPASIPAPAYCLGVKEATVWKMFPLSRFYVCLFLSCSVGQLFDNTTVLSLPNGTA